MIQKRIFDKMKKFILLLFLVACSISPQIPSVVFDTNPSSRFDVEIVSTSEDMARGLMFRDSMPEEHSMLFIFPETIPLAFWMKNTLIPLDMIFMDENMTVVHIANAVPCKADPCEHYDSPLPGKYVLEINSGLAAEKNIVVGTKMQLSQ